MKKVVRFVLRAAGILAVAAGIALLSAMAYLECRFSGKGAPILPPASEMLAPEKRDFRLAVFGDFAMQSDIFVPVLREISAGGYDFAVSVGDMFRWPLHGEGDYLRELLQSNLSIPLYALPGNHDRMGESFDAYNRTFGQSHYFFGYGDTLFVMLDDSSGGLDDRQFAWLENVLSHYRRDFRRCMLFMHIPPAAPDAGKVYLGVNPVSAQLEKIAARYPIDGIIAGHLHLNGETSFQGIPVWIVPCCGQKQRDEKFPDFGYREFRFKADGTIEAASHFIPGLERGRNYFLCYLAAEMPGEFQYFYFAAALLATGFALQILVRKK